MWQAWGLGWDQPSSQGEVSPGDTVSCLLEPSPVMGTQGHFGVLCPSWKAHGAQRQNGSPSPKCGGNQERPPGGEGLYGGCMLLRGKEGSIPEVRGIPRVMPLHPAPALLGPVLLQQLACELLEGELYYTSACAHGRNECMTGRNQN